jgi:hypothetical protein
MTIPLKNINPGRWVDKNANQQLTEKILLFI